MPLDKSTVLGLKEAAAVFRALPDIAREAFAEATEKATAAIEADAVRNLQTNRSVMTSALINNIGHTVNKATGQGRVGIRIGQTVMSSLATRQAVKVRGVVHSVGRDGSTRSIIKRPTKYGHLVEFKANKPFMVPAAKANTEMYLAQCRAAGGVIERDMSRIGGRSL